MSDFMAKCTKINFGWGCAPDPAGGAYSAPPDPLAGFKGPTSKGREGRRGPSTCLPLRFDNPGYGAVCLQAKCPSCCPIMLSKVLKAL